MPRGRSIGDGDGQGAGVGITLRWHDREVVPVALLECRILLGIDRPDLAVVRLVDREPYFSGGESVLPRPGDPIVVSSPVEDLFRGIVETLRFEEEAGLEPAVAIEACAAYQALREGRRERRHVDVSLGELASRIALDLGLEPHIECRPRRLPEVRVEGDPLKLLRRLAVEHRVSLSVCGGRLYLGERPALSGRRHVVRRGDPLTSLSVEHASGARRQASLSFRGRAAPRPLDAIALDGFGDDRDGLYRVERCRLDLEPSGWRTGIEASSLASDARGGPEG